MVAKQPRKLSALLSLRAATKGAAKQSTLSQVRNAINEHSSFLIPHSLFLIPTPLTQASHSPYAFHYPGLFSFRGFF